MLTLANMKLHKNIVDAILHSLHEIFEESKYADKVIERVLKSNPKWGGRDRRFIAETTYDIVRWYRLLCEGTETEKNNYQKIVEVYFTMKGISSDDAIKEKLESAQSIRKIRESIPDWMDELGVKELGEEKWEKEIHALNEEAKVILRANSLKVAKEKLKDVLDRKSVV